MEDFIPFELAVKLREKGFREDCIAYYLTDGELLYNRDQYRGGDYKSLLNSYNSLSKNPIGCEQIDAPTISQVLKWLRDKKNIYCLPYFEQGIDMWLYAICKPAYGCEFPEFISKSDYYTYELAAIAGIEYTLDNLL